MIIKGDIKGGRGTKGGEGETKDTGVSCIAFAEEEVHLVSLPFLKSNDAIIVDLPGDCWVDTSEIDYQEMYVSVKHM